MYYTVLSKNSWQTSFANSVSKPVFLLFIMTQNQEMLDFYQQPLNQLLYRWKQAWWKSKTQQVSESPNRKAEKKLHFIWLEATKAQRDKHTRLKKTIFLSGPLHRHILSIEEGSLWGSHCPETSLQGGGVDGLWPHSGDGPS